MRLNAPPWGLGPVGANAVFQAGALTHLRAPVSGDRSVKRAAGSAWRVSRAGSVPPGIRADIPPVLPCLDVRPPRWLRPIAPAPERQSKSFEEARTHPASPASIMRRPGCRRRRGALVGGHVNPRTPHHVPARGLVEQGMEPTGWLGAAISHALRGPKGVQAREPLSGRLPDDPCRPDRGSRPPDQAFPGWPPTGCLLSSLHGRCRG